MTDERPSALVKHLASIPRFLSIPLSAALGLSVDEPALQAYRIVDAVDLVLRFVVAHGAGFAHLNDTPVTLNLPDHPTIQHWTIAASRLANAARRGDLPRWGGLAALDALSTVMGPNWREATRRAGLVPLEFREFRNWIFHGGGVGLNRAAAAALIAELRPLAESLAEALGSWASSPDASGLVWPVFRGETEPQAFIRIEQDEAWYVPLVGERLLAVSGLEEVTAYRQRLGSAPEPIEFFDELVLERATHLVGRETEVAHIIEQLERQQKRPWWWLFAAMGRGKSSVMAGVAHRLGHSHRSSGSDSEQPVIVHFFRGGDARNTVEAFVRLATARLAPGELLAVDPIQRDRRLRELLRTKAPYVLCDGLDELERDRPGGTKRLLAFAQSGGRWVFASRDVPEVRAVLEGVRPLWRDGMPPLADRDLRTVLLNSELPGVRNAILASTHAQGSGDGTVHSWIDLVVSRCEGSPLYLELLLAQFASYGTSGDVRDAIDTMVASPNVIPRGLDALYRNLVNVWGTGDLAAFATPTLCLIARAREPLVPSVIVDLLLFDGAPSDTEEHGRTLALVEQILRRFGSVLAWERAPGGRAVRLDHDSFRRFLAKDPGHAYSWARAARLWARASEHPERFSNAATHLFRHAVSYLLAAQQVEATTHVLSSLEWHYGRLAALKLEGIEQTLDDFSKPEIIVEERSSFDLAQWHRFFGRHAHLLRRATAQWGPERIVHQLVCDYPPCEGAALAADALCKRIGEPALRLVPGAVRPVQPEALRFTLDREHISDGDAEVLQLRNGWLVAWALQGTVQVVRPDGREVSRFASPNSGYFYATTDDRLVFRGFDGESELWDPATGQLIERFGSSAEAPPERTAPVGEFLTIGEEPDANDEVKPGPLDAIAPFLHAGELEGALRLTDGGVATWSVDDRAVRVWDLPSWDLPPGDWVRDIADIGDGRVISRMSGSNNEVWSARRGVREMTEPAAHPRLLPNVGRREIPWPFTVRIDDSRQLTSDSKGISVLSRRDGTLLARFDGHELIPTGAVVICEGATIVSWAFHDAVRVWDSRTGDPLSRFSLHRDTVLGALETKDGRIASWSRDGTVWVWDPFDRRAPIAAFHPTIEMHVVVHPCADRLVASGAWSCPLFMQLRT